MAGPTKAYSHSLGYSDECWNGDGYCDGYIPEDETYGREECGCLCHNYESFDTIAEAAEWHKDQQQYR